MNTVTKSEEVECNRLSAELSRVASLVGTFGSHGQQKVMLEKLSLDVDIYAAQLRRVAFQSERQGSGAE